MPSLTDTIVIRPRASGVPRDLGRPVLPRSKSHAQRALVVGGLGRGDLRIAHLPDAGDVGVMRAAVAAMGATLAADGDGVTRVSAASALGPAEVACADNGTALRTLLVALGLLGGRATFTAGARLRERPLDAARAVLAALGVELSPGWPLQLGAPWELRLPLRLSIDASTTTQPATGALLGMACRAMRGLPTVPIEVRDARAAGYMALSVDVLEALGFGVATTVGAASTVYRVTAPARAVGVYEVPIDASAVAFPAALAVLHGVGVETLACAQELAAPRDRHPDWGVLADLLRIQTAAPGSTVEVTDLGRRPDTFPALCAAAAGRAGSTVLRGAPALRGKESDRIRAMALGLRPLGVSSDELPDGLVVHGRATFDADGGVAFALPAAPDHRVVMALALLGTRCPLGVSIPNARAVDKSWPDYFSWLARVASVRAR